MSKQTIKSSTGGVAIGEFKGGNITIYNHSGSKMSDEDIHSTEAQYLRSLLSECSNLEWLASVGYEDGKAPVIGLDTLYVPLMTNLMPQSKNEALDLRGEELALSAVEAINQTPQLVLTGNPGSGKSAFVNYLCLCLAGEIIKHENINLQALTEAVVDQKADDDGNKAPQQWQHGALLPVRLILRDFVASEDYFPKANEAGTAKHLLDFIQNELNNKTCSDYFGILKQRLRDGQTLIFFDGLDEVSQAEQRRERMIQCIHDFSKTHSNNRLVVTCRPYAYEQSAWQIANFTETALAKFTDGQITQFVDHWYASRKGLEEERLVNRATNLKQAIFDPRRAGLHELVERPLLLTLTTYLHANHYDLPEKRAELYENLLDLLINKWEKARYQVDDEAAALKCQQTSLAEYLRVGVSEIREVLERLAFKAHANQKAMTGTADIAEKDLVNELYKLSKHSQDKEVQSREIIHYLQERVGIIYQRGSDDKNTMYTFPHRSFQEYLAASYFKHEEKQWLESYRDESDECFDDYIELAAHLGRNDPDRWREVILLVGAIAGTDKYALWALLDSLSDVEKNEPDKKEAYGLLLAGEIITENISIESLPKKRQKSLKHIRKNLTKIIGSNYLSAKDRVIVGKCLAKLGDPRAEVLDVNAMQFCYIPKASFFMGSPKEDNMVWDESEQNGAGEYHIEHNYWMAKYPISTAQFRQFSTANPEYELHKLTLEGADNVPVTAVSWHDAIAFCQWLTEYWQEQKILPKNYRVTLPSEPEWEMAAKGGAHLPKKVESNHLSIQNISHQKNTVKLKSSTIKTLQRYPWGNNPDSEKMNYNRDIGSVSSLGVYPMGASPYGCEEMSGNVWEWTRSGFKGYPYPAEINKSECQAIESADSPLSRVLRGGAFHYDRRYVRCAVRFSGGPVNRNYRFGFRIVLSPLL